MILSDTDNTEFGQCFPRNLTYQMNPVSLGSFFGVLQGPFEAPPKYLEVKRTLVQFWYLRSLSKISKIFFLMYLFLFLAMLGLLLRQAFSACSGQGLLSGCVRRLLIVMPSLVSECGLWERGSVVVAPGLWSTGSVLWHTDWLFLGTWEPPKPGIRDGTGIPCIAGCFFSTEPPGKPLRKF